VLQRLKFLHSTVTGRAGCIAEIHFSANRGKKPVGSERLHMTLYAAQYQRFPEFSTRHVDPAADLRQIKVFQFFSQRLGIKQIRVTNHRCGIIKTGAVMSSLKIDELRISLKDHYIG